MLKSYDQPPLKVGNGFGKIQARFAEALSNPNRDLHFE